MLVRVIDIFADGKVNMRYSANQRAVESRTRKYKKLRRKDKKESKVEVYRKDPDAIENGVKKTVMTVEEAESVLSDTSYRSTSTDGFKNYIKIKNQLSNELSDYYSGFWWRKLWLKTVIKTKNPNNRMVSKFRKTYGSPDKVLVCIGDWCQRKQMKHLDPTIGIGLRDVFRRHGYKVLLVDEYLTSKTCCACFSENEKFMKVMVPNLSQHSATSCLECCGFKNNKKSHHVTKSENVQRNTHSHRLCHGLLRCKNVHCKKVWNRDKCGSRNILLLAVFAIKGQPRPVVFQRKKTSLEPSLFEADSITQITEFVRGFCLCK